MHTNTFSRVSTESSFCLLSRLNTRQIIQNKYSMKREKENKKGGRERYRKEYKGKGEIDRGNEIR